MSRKSNADFSQVEALADRIQLAVSSDDKNSQFNREKILRTGAYRQMDQLIIDAPVGKDGSNWYDYTFVHGKIPNRTASYKLKGRTSKAGTLARGWVDDNPRNGGVPSRGEGKAKVDRTHIVRVGNTLNMKFYNTAPYCYAVEYGHWVRLPYFYSKPPAQRGHGEITKYVPGKYFAQRAVWHAERTVKLTIKKETVKALKQVMKK